MTKFCKYEKHGGICEKTGTYCNLGACPHEEMVDYAPVRYERWIEHKTVCENWREDWCECSRCGHVPDSPTDETPYCPNCGAKMDKEVADETERTN